MSIVSIFIIAVATTRCIPVQADRILAIETVPGKSHWYFMSAVLRALTDGGHDVTVFTPFPDGNRENYTEVDMSADFSLLLDMDLAELKSVFNNPFTTVSFMINAGRSTCEIIYKNDRLNDILAKDLHTNFDAIITEPLMSSCLTYVAAKSNLPLIFTVPNPITYVDRIIFGDHPNPTSVAPLLADHAVPRTFTHRLSNTVLLLYTNILVALEGAFYRIIDPKPYDLYTFVPPSLVFTNNNFISDLSRSIYQNAVSVGGIHLKTAKRIPKVCRPA